MHIAHLIMAMLLVIRFVIACSHIMSRSVAEAAALVQPDTCSEPKQSTNLKALERQLAAEEEKALNMCAQCSELKKQIRLVKEYDAKIGQFDAELKAAENRVLELKKEREAYIKEFKSAIAAPVPTALGTTDSSLAESTEDILRNYPNVGFDGYAEANVWQINLNYPGVQAIHKDPWIFVVPNLLSAELCGKLMLKVESKLTASDFGDFGGGVRRTSADTRLAFEETVGLQTVFANVLNMTPQQLEPLKVIRYLEGQEFGAHTDDGMEGNTFPADKINVGLAATSWVYLNDVDSGGESQFCGWEESRWVQPLNIKPKLGMALIHFPITLKPKLVSDGRATHKGLPASSYKFIATQWGFNTEVDRATLLKDRQSDFKIRGRLDDVDL